MMKKDGKMRNATLAVMVLCMMAGVASAEFVFDGPGWTADPTAWELGDNWADASSGWTRGVLPGEFDQALINNAAEAILTSSQTVNFLRVAAWGQAGTSTVNSGGNLHVKNQGSLAWGDGIALVGDEGAAGVLNINDGANVIDRTLLFAHNNAASVGILNMNGGTLDVGANTGGGIWDGGIVGSAGDLHINIYGGTLTTTILNDWNWGSGAYEIYFGSTAGRMIVTEAWLIDPGQTIDNMLQAGQITAAPGLEVVVQKFESSPGVWDAELYAVIPEPATLGLMGMVGLGMLLTRRRVWS
jgi:hypothetical protein